MEMLTVKIIVRREYLLHDTLKEVLKRENLIKVIFLERPFR